MKVRGEAVRFAVALLGLLALADASFARELTFEERVDAQEAIDRVYYSHQVGAAGPFEEAVSRAVLESKVRTSLRLDAALRDFWQSPVTGSALQREVDRMTSGSRMPDRLREIFAALGNDPFLIQECLARPLLVSRLARGFFAWDSRIHAGSRDRALALQAGLRSGTLDPWAEDPDRVVVSIAKERQPNRKVQVGGDAARSTSPIDAIPEDSAQPVLRLIEEREAFLVEVLLDEDDEEERWGVYQVPKSSWDAWWGANGDRFDASGVVAVAIGAPLSTPMASPAAAAPDCSPGDVWDNKSLDDLPAGRRFHSAVWTGSEMIVWGGDLAPGVYTNTGGRYDPATDTWRLLSTVNAPEARSNHAAVWTGSAMIVWGGFHRAGFNSEPVDSGGRYDPATDTWTPTSLVGVEPRGDHTATWTGTEMLVWGGWNGQAITGTGMRYDPAHDTWAALSSTGAPSPRFQHAAVWTGRQLIIWGGFGTSNNNTGARYDPATDTWSAMTLANAPEGRTRPVAVWTGSHMLIWAGRSAGPWTLRSGGRYDPEVDSWSPITANQSPLGHDSYGGVWTGTRMIVWGGDAVLGLAQGEGGSYDPGSDAWSRISTVNSPATRNSASVIWTGDQMIVWGGRGDTMTNTGGRYRPATDSWLPVEPTHAPEQRSRHTATWTGSRMVIWGGANASGIILGNGAQYDPVIDAWVPVSATDAPSPRAGHTALWTGREILFYGGSAFSSTFFNTGPAYDPATDTWRPVPAAGAPPRGRAVWTGSRMLVWDPAVRLGAQYDPTTDRWTAISSVDSPVTNLPAVIEWAGNVLVVWGQLSIGQTNTGSVYDPGSDRWKSMATVNAPVIRSGPSAVWNGRELIVWGGTEAGFGAANTGGRYDPALDRWTRTSVTNTPEARSDHVALWTGKAMLVWSGHGRDVSLLNTGGLYDPDLDQWKKTSLTMVPAPRMTATGVWTGRSMIAWGGAGLNGRDAIKTGGQYFPEPVFSAPVVDAGADRLVECTGPDGTSFGLHGSATGCDALEYEWTGPFPEGNGVVHGSDVSVTLPPGRHEVLLRVDDTHGQSTTDRVVLTVQDTTPPILLCPPAPIAECAGPAGTPVSPAAATALDTCSANVGIANDRTSGGPDATARYALGTTPLTFSATDGAGNTARCTTAVSVQDTMPPALAVVPDITTLWPPNHELVPVRFTWQAVDVCDANPFVTLDAATSSEPDDAPGTGDGSTTGDVEGCDRGSPDDLVMLRAERAAAGPGRVYELSYRAVDGSGNATPALAVVTVAHDPGHDPERLLVRLETDVPTGGLRLYWPNVPNALSYDVISGDLSQVQVERGQLSLGAVRVLARGTRETAVSEGPTGAVPAPGAAFFYLVQQRTDRGGVGYGTESAPWPRLPAVCDGGCP